MPHVLVIDDNPCVCLLARGILEAAGFEVSVAEDGAAGVRAMWGNTPDLVICDLFMPEKDGLEVLRELRHEFPRVPVLAVSAGGFDGTVDLLHLARQLGAAAVLRKPLQARSLVDTVRRSLSG